MSFISVGLAIIFPRRSPSLNVTKTRPDLQIANMKESLWQPQMTKQQIAVFNSEAL
jgi:hypothetical protein